MSIPNMDGLTNALGRPDLSARNVLPCRQCGKLVAVPAWLGDKWSGWCSPECMKLGEARPRSKKGKVD